jgi:hypothetical protein
MIIEVEQPTFLLDKNNPMNVSYKNEEGDNWKSIMVSTYLHGFPPLKEGDILYKYKDNRGYIYKVTNDEGEYKLYVESFFTGELKENYTSGGYDFDDYYYAILDNQNLLGWPQDGPLSKEDFINTNLKSK